MSKYRRVHSRSVRRRLHNCQTRGVASTSRSFRANNRNEPKTKLRRKLARENCAKRASLKSLHVVLAVQWQISSWIKASDVLSLSEWLHSGPSCVRGSKIVNRLKNELNCNMISSICYPTSEPKSTGCGLRKWKFSLEETDYSNSAILLFLLLRQIGIGCEIGGRGFGPPYFWQNWRNCNEPLPTPLKFKASILIAIIWSFLRFYEHSTGPDRTKYTRFGRKSCETVIGEFEMICNLRVVNVSRKSNARLNLHWLRTDICQNWQLAWFCP